jgi:hypothetical protein
MVRLPKRIFRSLMFGKTPGWVAQYVVDGQVTRRFFSEAAHGGAEGARQAASAFAWRDIEAHMERLATHRRLAPRRNTRFAMPGIGRYERPDGSDFWMAYWDDETGRKRHRKFSVARFGEEGARALAVEARLEAIEALRLMGVMSGPDDSVPAPGVDYADSVLAI